MNLFGLDCRRVIDYLPALDGLLLFAAPHVVVMAALPLSELVAGRSDAPSGLESALFAGVFVLLMMASGLYNHRPIRGLGGTVARMLVAFALAGAAMAAFAYTVPMFSMGVGVLPVAMALAFVAIVAVRGALLALLKWSRSRRRVVIIGAGHRVRPIAHLRPDSDLVALEIVGFVACPGDRVSVPKRRLVSPPPGALSDWVVQHRIHEIVFAPDERRNSIDMEELMRCRKKGTVIKDPVAFYERETGRVSPDLLLPSWFAFAPGFPSSRISEGLKRGLDIVSGIVLLVLAAPLLLLAAAAIWLDSGFRGPIFYRQIRVGEDGREFELLKLRTMRTDAEAGGKAMWAQRNDPRVTRTGRVLRLYRVDELPQLFNILRGDMSLVGPRPERPEFVQRLQRESPHYADRCRVKPGLTGWAQISYPYGATDEEALEKLQYDLYYIKNWSLHFDLEIMLQTAEVVVRGLGAR